MCFPDCDKVTILSALGHDWDRSCGDLAVRQEDYSKEYYEKYKKDHALNSAMLFCQQLRNFFDDDLMISKIYKIIEIHEEGGCLEADQIDIADSLSFFDPDTINWYRNAKKYKDTVTKAVLPEDQQKIERENGLDKKIKYMTNS